jgi:hypothetical protein
MTKRLTIQSAVEEYELYTLYNDVIESYGEDLEDPSLVSDLYDLIDEYEEEYEFWPDSDGNYTESFESNLKEAISNIVEESDDMVFVDDGYADNEDIPGIVEDDLRKGAKEFEIDLDEDEYPYDD